jgi:nucleotide-binding universal stress UspA family protein
MEPKEVLGLSNAISDFHRARSQASLKEMLGRLTGESSELLSYQEIREKLIPLGSADRGLREIPLAAIVGSVGRYLDFTRDFLPKQTVNPERWARVKIAASGMIGLPPIDVYQIGDVYFVEDGNHRVSVARELGATHIQAYVTEVRTLVPLEPDTAPDGLILKAEYAAFLKDTELKRLRPEASLEATIPGQYDKLREHIAVHQYYMGLDQRSEIPYDEAVAHWYDNVYLPVVAEFRQEGILRAFPDRTETDLYLWIAEHRAALEEELGWKVEPGRAAHDLIRRYGSSPPPGILQFGSRLLDVIAAGKLETGPPAGEWRKETHASASARQLFHDILVPVSGNPAGWAALEQAFKIVAREHSKILGLHVVAGEAQAASPDAEEVKAEFEARCAAANVAGVLSLDTGEVARQIAKRAALADLVVTNLAFPPPASPRGRLDSGFHDLVRLCPRPILATPGNPTRLERPVLAYDGSPKANEALFLAAYFACSWNVPLTVVTAFDDRIAPETLMRARLYLEEKEIEADYRSEQTSAAEAILGVAEEISADLILVGGYGLNPLLEMVIGSTVDRVLRQARIPVLICR